MINHIYINTFKDYIGMDYSYNDQDNVILDCISAATALNESLIGRTLAYGTYTEFHNTKDNFNVGYDMYGMSHEGYQFSAKHTINEVKNFPVDTTAPFVVNYDPVRAFNFNYLIDPSLYALNPETGELYLYFLTVRTYGGLQITYSAGYPGVPDPDNENDVSIEGSIPADLKLACVYQTLMFYQKRTPNNINVDAQLQVKGSSKITFINKAGISPESMAILVRYRRHKIAVV